MLDSRLAASGQKIRNDLKIINQMDLRTKKVPLKSSATVSIAASGTGTATISVPSTEVWFIKSWTITKGADVTVTSIQIDSNDTFQTAALADTEAEYGDLINANTNITAAGSNAGAAAEDLTIEVKGYKVIV